MFFLARGVVRKRTEGRNDHTGLASQINVQPPFLFLLPFAINWSPKHARKAQGTQGFFFMKGILMRGEQKAHHHERASFEPSILHNPLLKFLGVCFYF
jgi:hypothetical protein